MTREYAEEIVSEAMWDFGLGIDELAEFCSFVADGTYSVSLAVGHAVWVVSDGPTRSQMRGWLAQQALNVQDAASVVLRTLEEGCD
tara:strand:- start:429 stop:686 length:258 start_codon:yes stop_codon:yes gene_type:complete